MKMKRNCSNCIRGIQFPTNRDMFCREKGMVSPDFVCTKHKQAPEARPVKEMNYKCMDCEHFICSDEQTDPAQYSGTCRLFTVRQFDGSQRNACSKMIKKSMFIVS